MVLFGGTGREGGTFTPYSSCLFRTPNFCYTQSGYSCYIPRAAAAAYSTGIIYPELDFAAAAPLRYDDPAYQRPEVIVLWGKEPLKSNPDGFFGHSVIDLMKRGSRVISIDPRVNWMSTRADLHLRLRPGTDVALGMAMIRIIIDEDLYDHDFVENWCYGFDQLNERVHDPIMGMTPERAAEICGLDVEDIYKAARMYGTARPASILWGLAVDQKKNGAQNGQVILELTALTGNIDRPGGQLAEPLCEQYTTGNDYGYDAIEDMDEFRGKMIGMAQYPAYCMMIMNSHCDLTLQAMETDEPYPLKMGFFMGTNPLANSAAEPKRWENAIKRMEFVATIEVFMTASAQATCDLFFPLATVTERKGTVHEEYGVSPLCNGCCNPAIKELGDSRSDIEFCIDLGKLINPEYFEKFNCPEDLINDYRFGNKARYEDMHKEVYWQQENRYYKYETGELRPDGQPGFMTPTGRIELYANMFAQFGDDPLPYYLEPEFGPAHPEADKYPFILTTGARTYAYFHSEQRQVPYLRELNPDPLFEINPEDALRLGITDGQWCKLYNMFGEAKLKASVTVKVEPGVIHAQHGWSFPEEDGFDNGDGVYDTYRSNVNNLMEHFHFGKLGFGVPFKCNMCNIEPLAESYDTDMQKIWDMFKREDL